eukprot:COSAG05_NODE_7943_length_753_cov_1.185015_1_plen_227_part_01
MQLHNWHKPLEGAWSGISFAEACAQLFVDALCYTLLGFYLEQVLPKAYGVRRSVWFPLHWVAELLGGSRQVGVGENGSPSHALGSTSSGGAEEVGDTTRFEPVALPNVCQLETEQRCVRIQNLRKTFVRDLPNLWINFTPLCFSLILLMSSVLQNTPDGEKVAVHGLTLSMYEGQIFVLLGHNGAGKTTTIHMLTGLYEPTSGDAQVFGKSVSNNMLEVRNTISVCP